MFTFESRILWAHSSKNRDYLKLPKSGFFCGFFVCFCFFFSCSMWTVSCDMENLVHWPGIEPRPPSWEHSLSHLVLGKSQWNCLRVIKDNKFPKYLFCRISHAALFGKKKKMSYLRMCRNPAAGPPIHQQPVTRCSCRHPQEVTAQTARDRFPHNICSNTPWSPAVEILLVQSHDLQLEISLHINLIVSHKCLNPWMVSEHLCWRWAWLELCISIFVPSLILLLSLISALSLFSVW